MSSGPSHDSLLELRRRSQARRKRLSTSLAWVGKRLPSGLRGWLSRQDKRLAYLRMGEGDFVAPYLGEFRVYINVAAGDIEREMFCGSYEREFRDNLKAHLHPGDTVVDIGANVGALTFFFAQSVGPSGRILAFEPGPAFFRRLQANLGLNPAVQGQIQAFPFGLSSEPGELFWNEDKEFPGNAGLLLNQGTRVVVSTVDKELASLPRCQLIKIDVEGMELEVLRGAVATLKRLRPKIVLEMTLEFEAIRQSPIRRLTQEFLREHGYRLYAMLPHGKLQPVEYPAFPAMVLAVPSA